MEIAVPAIVGLFFGFAFGYGYGRARERSRWSIPQTWTTSASKGGGVDV